MWTPRVFSDVEFVKFIRLVIFILDTKDTLLNIINDLCLKKKLENKKQKKRVPETSAICVRLLLLVELV